jgi:hypothetical protein
MLKVICYRNASKCVPGRLRGGCHGSGRRAALQHQHLTSRQRCLLQDLQARASCRPLEEAWNTGLSSMPCPPQRELVHLRCCCCRPAGGRNWPAAAGPQLPLPLPPLPLRGKTLSVALATVGVRWLRISSTLSMPKLTALPSAQTTPPSAENTAGWVGGCVRV